jgi:hypothetical protein
MRSLSSFPFFSFSYDSLMAEASYTSLICMNLSDEKLFTMFEIIETIILLYYNLFHSKFNSVPNSCERFRVFLIFI